MHNSHKNRKRQRMICNRRQGNGIEINTIFRALELIGIYNEYNGDDDSFYKFYRSETSFRKYYYRNRGIDIIYELICKKYGDIEYNISKRSMRRTGISVYKTRVYEGTDIMVDVILWYICENRFLEDFYISHIHEYHIEGYLLSQYDCIKIYVGNHYGSKAECFASVERNIQERIEIG